MHDALYEYYNSAEKMIVMFEGFWHEISNQP